VCAFFEKYVAQCERCKQIMQSITNNLILFE